MPYQHTKALTSAWHTRWTQCMFMGLTVHEYQAPPVVCRAASSQHLPGLPRVSKGGQGAVAATHVGCRGQVARFVVLVHP